MNKIQKVLLLGFSAFALVMLYGAIFAERIFATAAPNVAILTLSSISNNVAVSTYPTNTFTTNINGVASQYTGYPTNIATNSVQIMAFQDKTVFCNIINTGNTPIVISMVNPVITNHGWVISAGASLSFPTTGAGGAPAPSVLYSAPLTSSVSGASVEQWLSGTGN
jgi:hypothetical protein